MVFTFYINDNAEKIHTLIIMVKLVLSDKKIVMKGDENYPGGALTYVPMRSCSRKKTRERVSFLGKVTVRADRVLGKKGIFFSSRPSSIRV